MSHAQSEHDPAPLALEEEPIKLLVYGDYGRGKTTLAGTFPRPLIIDSNHGLITLALQGQTPDRFVPTGNADLAKLAYWVIDHSDEYDTVVIDTLDSLCILLMMEITDDAVAHKQAKGDKPSLRMQLVPEQGDYFANQRQMFKFLNDLLGFGKHIVVTSALREKNGRTMPNVSAGMDGVVRDFVDIIGELVILDEIDEDDKRDDPDLFDGCRVMFTQESNGRGTKSRFQSVKPYVVEPTYEKLATLVLAEYQEKMAAKKPAPTRRKRAAGGK